MTLTTNELPDVGICAKPRSEIILCFSSNQKNREPRFCFGKDHSSPISCRKCLPSLELFVYIPFGAYEKLAAVAEEEDWSFKKENSDSSQYGGLRYYITQTFDKINYDRRHELDKEFPELVYGKDGETAIFCTGLLSRECGTYIYAHCSEKDDYGTFRQVEWVYQPKDDAGNYGTHPLLKGIFRKTMKNCGLPYPANWTQYPSELIIPYREFSPKNVDIRNKHIFVDNIERIKHEATYSYVDDNESLDHFLKVVWPITRKQLARNYKVAIPTWYHHTISILLPLYLNESCPDRPTNALVIVRNNTEKGCKYKAVTCLTLEMARRAARVIATTDYTWLSDRNEITKTSGSSRVSKPEPSKEWGNLGALLPELNNI